MTQSGLLYPMIGAIAAAIIAALCSYALGQRKAIAEPAKMLANGYSSLVDDQREEIDALRDSLAELETKIGKLTNGNELLQEQLDDMAARIVELETEVERLRTENNVLGKTAEQMRIAILQSS